jgi:glycosyltransferase involved in cell wall biosynthesis
MHIGIDARFLGSPSYGLAQYSESLLTALARRDSENQYTVFVNAGLDHPLHLGPNFNIVPLDGRPLSAQGLLRSRLAIRHRNLDLIHVHFPLAPVGTHVSTIITVHDVIPFTRSAEKGKNVRFPVWDRIGGWGLYPATMRKARWIVCVSKATRDRLVELFPEVFHKTIILTSGVEDPKRLMPEPATADMIRARLNAPDRYVFYSGSSGENKNIPCMIESFALLRKQNEQAAQYSFLLDLTGDLSGLGAARSTIRQYGVDSSVRILTQLTAEERSVLFKNASLLFMASKEEGFGLPVLRAQLAQVPVLAADAGALPEICGEGALLVDPDNPREMVEMLAEALFDANLRNYLIKKGEVNASHYSWDDTALQLRQIYELLC